MLMGMAPRPHTPGLAAAVEDCADVCGRDTDGVDVLSAQVAALARRSAVTPEVDDSPSTITVRDLTLDFDRCQVERDDVKIPLTPTEFKILAFMAKSSGKVASPVEILRAVQDYTYSDRSAPEFVKVYIRLHRRTIDPTPRDPTYTTTGRGFG